MLEDKLVERIMKLVEEKVNCTLSGNGPEANKAREAKSYLTIFITIYNNINAWN
jgi:hypothetical protein